MKKFGILLGSLSLATMVAFGDDSGSSGNGGNAYTVYSCKYSGNKNLYGGGGKTMIDIKVPNIGDEKDILSAKPVASTKHGSNYLEIFAGLAKDDECKGNCRFVLGLDVNNKESSYGYSNSIEKLGVLTRSYKLSCVKK